MIKLIAPDIDGTLLDAKMSITNDNASVIREAERLGIEFMVATSRVHTETKPVLEEAGTDCVMTTLNGAQVFDKDGHSLFTAGIEKEAVIEVLTISSQHSVYYETSTNRGILSEHQEKRIENFAAHIAESMPYLTYKVTIAMTSAHLPLLYITYVDRLDDILKDDSTKVLKIIGFSMDGPKVSGPAGMEIEELNDLAVTSSALNNIEINHRLARKGIAVARVAKERGIPAEQVTTIGDNLNDVSMIQWVGISFAMGNAELELKEYAEYETATNLENGVGETILRAIREDL